MKTLETPFTGEVPAVFVHVGDLEKSVEWYSRLLGMEKPDSIRKDIHIFRLEGGANIVLRYSKSPQPTTQVLFSIPAPDLVKTRNFFDSNDIKYENKSEETNHFTDLDGNILMGCSI